MPRSVAVPNCDDCVMVCVITPPSLSVSDAVGHCRSSTGKGQGNMRRTRMNTAPQYRSRFACVVPLQFKMRNGMEEVVGSIPTRSTNKKPLPVRRTDNWKPETRNRESILAQGLEQPASNLPFFPDHASNIHPPGKRGCFPLARQVANRNQ